MNEFSSTRTRRNVVGDSAAKSREKNTRVCTRAGCGSRIESTRDMHNHRTTKTPRLDLPRNPPSHQTGYLPVKAEASKRVIRPNNPKIKLDKIPQNEGSREASNSSSNPDLRKGKKTMMRPELWIKDGSTSASSSSSSSSLVLKKGSHGVRNGASTSERRLELNLGRRRVGEAGHRSVPSRAKKTNGESSRDGISIRRGTSPSVGIQRSTVGVRRLSEQDNDSNGNRISNVAGQYSLDEIAEMLLALERIEQDEDMLSYEEQMLVLETNLFLNGVLLHDQHREMRLDIDNMSYEELLALEERMGNVSTALSEEALKKCIKKSIFCNDTTENEDDIKCSICQEEYKVGNKFGKLGCEHKYHVECIEKWLRIKNWCPICKTSAVP